ncbi:FAD-dependent oxidoreductase [Mucilaginibacter conchicola]|uniref:FAD-dependent oxidoreductase n=1 Tax=Mucilaginibacter conchicola TaxID=2303333 RepID=A0A372NPY5_9SPHI|nr:FAD-dependent monooxygenase [Mucilaginibacter conchicola]RFZ90996.1 FAD-dependent oxidoreductase [Mucilaginibacter conchicola]
MKTTQDNTLYDVIISGAGPVGLFLACELALAKCKVLILERAEEPHSPLKQLPFGLRGLNSPSIEALYRRGLLQEMALHKRFKTPHISSNPKPGEKAPGAGHFARIPFNRANFDTTQWKYRLPGSLDTSIFTSMEEIEEVLYRRAENLGVAIKYGIGVTGFDQTDDCVTVQAGDQTFQSKWLVGCDGSRSVVRKAGGFEFAGTEPEFTGYTAKVDIADPEKLHTGGITTERGMYLLSQVDYLIMQDFDGGAFHNSGQPVTLEHVQATLRRISDTDVTITALHLSTTWTDRARQTTAYRNGRVLLAGDAAHIHAPLGGQGLNLGLGDAMNLGWKLAATIHGQAPEGLLDTYYTERYPIGAKVLDWSRAQVTIMKPNPHSQALNAIIRDLIDTRDGATYFAGRVMGLNMHYDLNGKHPMVGYSVPAIEFENGTSINNLMTDGKGVLLSFEDDSQLKSFADTNHLKYISGTAKETFGVKALLIRPDGFIAWATDSEADISELTEAAQRWFK